MIFEKIKELIVNELKVEPEKVTMEARLVEDIGADSLDSVELIMNIEDEYNISIGDEIIQGIKTVGDLVTYIEKETK